MLCEGLPQKEFHSTLVKERMQNKKQNLSKIKQSVKKKKFETLTLLRSKNSKLTKDAYIFEDHAQKFADLNNFSEILQN